MSKEAFRIVFRGEVALGRDLGSVKVNLRKLTGFDEARIDRLFSVPETVMKSGLDKATADRYLAALERTGAVFYCERLLTTREEVLPDSLNSPAAASAQGITCPKCGASQPAGVSCISCGLIYERYKPSRAPATTPEKSLRRPPALLLAIIVPLLIFGAACWVYLPKKGPSPAADKSNREAEIPEHLLGGAVQNGPLNLSGTVSTLASVERVAARAVRTVTPESVSSEQEYCDRAGEVHPAVAAGPAFVSTGGITTDGRNLYVADPLANKIRMISLATGSVTTLATDQPTVGVTGITTDGINLYATFPSFNHIKKINISTGVTTTLAGAIPRGSTDGIGAAAQFSRPSGITTDGVNLYVTEHANSTIRKIVISTGAVTTVAGLAENTGIDDGAGARARFRYPSGITTDGTNLYVVDAGNGRIRKVVIATGEVTTLAGSAGSADLFKNPIDITIDGTNLYVTDSTNCTVQQIDIATGSVSTVAGTSGVSGANDGTGSDARFDAPKGITSDGKNLYLADANDHPIRKIE